MGVGTAEVDVCSYTERANYRSLLMCWMIKKEGATTVKGQFGPLGA